MPTPLRFTLDGDTIEARPGDTIAAALLRAKVTTFTRSIKYHRPRGPFCFAGSCGQCLMRVDGVPSVPACTAQVEEGMQCVRQNAPLGLAETDVFRATDFLFPEHLDHHHLMIRSRLLGRVALEVARRLAGLGELPARDQAPVQGTLRKARIVVVGAGEAGLAAARAAAEASKDVLLIERGTIAGDFGGERLENAECVGLYPNDTAVPGNALLAVRAGDGIVAVVAERVVVATGGVSQPRPFPGVDRPGVYAARGLIALHESCGVRVGDKLVVAGEGDELPRCAEALRAAGYAVIATDKPVTRALGNPVRAVEIGGERVRCDALALADEPAPFHELATAAGAVARWDAKLNGFPVEADADGRTVVPWLFVAGRVAGRPASSGAAAGKAAAA